MGQQVSGIFCCWLNSGNSKMDKPCEWIQYGSTMIVAIDHHKPLEKCSYCS